MKSNELVIKDFDKGIGQSPFAGFMDIHNLNFSTIPGVIYQNFQAVATVQRDDYVTGITKNPELGVLYSLDHDGNVFQSTDAITWTAITGNGSGGGRGQGLIVWKNYLFVARSTAIDVYGPLDSGPSWTNSWQTLTGGSLLNDVHPMLASAAEDDALYIGNSTSVASIIELSEFEPTDSNTYTWNDSAIDLPTNHKVKCLSELGQSLMIGTVGEGNTEDNRVANIFPWDRSSSSFGIPIQLNEFGVHQMLNVNNILYIVAGLEGSIYKSNGSSTVFLTKLPP